MLPTLASVVAIAIIPSAFGRETLQLGAHGIEVFYRSVQANDSTLADINADCVAGKPQAEKVASLPWDTSGQTIRQLCIGNDVENDSRHSPSSERVYYRYGSRVQWTSWVRTEQM